MHFFFGLWKIHLSGRRETGGWFKKKNDSNYLQSDLCYLLPFIALLLAILLTENDENPLDLDLVPQFQTNPSEAETL